MLARAEEPSVPAINKRLIGILGGIVVSFLPLAFPIGFLDPKANRLTAIFGLVIVYWLTEAIPIPVTAFLGVSLSVVMGVASAGEAFAGFGDPIVFLFIGSFLLARSMAVSRLDKRIAYSVLAMEWVGASPARILFSFGLICYTISMWVSNTTTTAIMYPIAVAILSTVMDQQKASTNKEGIGPSFDPRYATGLLLITAYAASISGMTTPVGTPPEYYRRWDGKKVLNREISFVH